MFFSNISKLLSIFPWQQKFFFFHNLSGLSFLKHVWKRIAYKSLMFANRGRGGKKALADASAKNASVFLHAPQEAIESSKFSGIFFDWAFSRSGSSRYRCQTRTAPKEIFLVKLPYYIMYLYSLRGLCTQLNWQFIHNIYIYFYLFLSNKVFLPA